MSFAFLHDFWFHHTPQVKAQLPRLNILSIPLYFSLYVHIHVWAAESAFRKMLYILSCTSYEPYIISFQSRHRWHSEFCFVLFLHEHICPGLFSNQPLRLPPVMSWAVSTCCHLSVQGSLRWEHAVGHVSEQPLPRHTYAVRGTHKWRGMKFNGGE